MADKYQSGTPADKRDGNLIVEVEEELGRISTPIICTSEDIPSRAEHGSTRQRVR